jgi:cell division protein FtsW
MSEALENGISKPLSRRQAAPRLPEMDWTLLIAAAALIGLGFVMVASASMPIADRQFHDPFHFIWRHAAALAFWP